MPHNRRDWVCVPWIAVAVCFITNSALAQKAPSAKLAPTKLPENSQSELVDNPLTFRLVQLAGIEESLAAVDAALRKAGYQSKVASTDADQYEKNNELMDRKGGGPVKWDKFYGRSAEKFFYHPTDPNTRYRNPVPISQRPPQFDYIYRANSQQAQKAKDEIAALGNKADKLLERKRQLESQQAWLWFRISAALIAQREISDRPIYAYHLKTKDDTEADAAEKVKAIESIAQYMRVLTRAIAAMEDSTGKDQRAAFLSIKQNSEQARKELMLGVSIITDSEVAKSIQPLSDLAKRLTVVANSAAESQVAASEAEKADDDVLKQNSRGLLQTAIIDLPDKFAVLDDGITKLVADWKLIPVSDKPLAEITLIKVPISGEREPKPVQPDKKKERGDQAIPRARDGADGLKTKVTLKAPFPQNFKGALADRISVQYAVMEILKQAHLAYDFQKSQANVGELARRWVTPNINDKECASALEEILTPLGLAYAVEGERVVLQRK